MKLIVFLLGSLLLCGLIRLWRRSSAVMMGGYALLVLAYFFVPLATSSNQVPTDIAYQWQPWSSTLEAPIKPSNPLLSDVVLQMLPFHRLVRSRLLAGQLPLWSSEMGTGQPLLGDAQSAPFAPLHLMALPLPPIEALTVAAAWQTLLALLLMHCLLESLGASLPGAVLGAVAFAFSTFATCWAYHPHAMAMAWIPGILLSLVLLRRGEIGGTSGLVACSLGVLLSGHPETAATAALVSTGTVAVLATSAHGISRLRFIGKAFLGAVLIGCFAAPVLLPILDAIPESVRQAMVARRADLVQPPPFRPRFLATAIDPLYFGSPRDGNWHGPSNFNELCSGYAGLLALALSLAGSLRSPRRVLPLFTAGLLALLISFRVDPFFSLMHKVPVLGTAPLGRLRLVYVLAIAIAAGLSLDLLQNRSGRLAAGAGFLATGSALLCFSPPHEVWQQGWYLLTLMGVLVCVLALWLARREAIVKWLVATALLVDLLSLSARYQPVVSSQLSLAPPPAVSFIENQRIHDRWPFRVLGELDGLKPNLPSLYGLWEPLGNDPIQPARAQLIIGRALRPQYQLGRDIRLGPPLFPQALLDFLDVRYLLTRRRANLPAPWVAVWDGPGSRIWRNDAATGLFFMPNRLRLVLDPIEATLASDDLRDEAFSSSQHVMIPFAESQTGRVEQVRVEPNGFRLEVSTPTGGVLASSIAMVRGWQAMTSRGKLPVFEIDGGFVGVQVGPGRHSIHLAYEPPHWRLGLVLFACGLVLGCGLVFHRFAAHRFDSAGLAGSPSS